MRTTVSGASGAGGLVVMWCSFSSGRGRGPVPRRRAQHTPAAPPVRRERITTTPAPRGPLPGRPAGRGRRSVDLAPEEVGRGLDGPRRRLQVELDLPELEREARDDLVRERVLLAQPPEPAPALHPGEVL